MNEKLWSGIVSTLNGMGIDPLALFDAWKLGPGTGWENVAEHCLVQAGVHRTFSVALGCFNKDEINELIRTALCHNLKKRAGIKPSDFTSDELAHAEELLAAAQPNWQMVESVLAPKFLVQFATVGASLKERVLFIVDDMARNGVIVPFGDRIDEVSARNPDPEPEIRRLLGRPYWDVEREVGHVILTGLGVELRRRGHDVTTMRDIAQFINDLLYSAFTAEH